jgi:hypothetical protein
LPCHRILFLHHHTGVRGARQVRRQGSGDIGPPRFRARQDLDVSHAIGLALAAGPERWTAMEGGVPVLVDGQCIGGVGVSGGDWETDLRIAKAAVESIGANWK